MALRKLLNRPGMFTSCSWPPRVAKTSALVGPLKATLPLHATPRRCCYTEGAVSGRVLWPLDHHASMIAEGHLHGTRFSPAICTTNTRHPLPDQAVQRALHLLTRKISALRLGITRRDGRLHYYEADDVTLDYKVLADGADMLHEIDLLNAEGFPGGEPPLCKVRLARAHPDAPCYMPEYQQEYPHQYNIMFFPHHSPYDGLTFSCIFAEFFNILNKVLLGEEVDMTPVGKFEPYTEIEAKDAVVEAQLKEDPRLLERLRQELVACNKAPVLLRAFPPPQDATPRTRYAFRNVDRTLFAVINKLSKQKGLTFNSVFEAAINTAIVNLLVDAGIDDEQFEMSVTNATSMRRYMAPKQYPVMGLHVRSTSHLVPTPRNVSTDFWTYAKRIDTDLKRLLRSEAAITQEVVRRLAMPPVDPRRFYDTQPALVREYGATNLGAIPLFGDGKALQVTNVALLAVVHRFTYSTLHQMFTFRGAPRYTLSYAAEHMTHTTAALLMDAVLDVFNDISTSH